MDRQARPDEAYVGVDGGGSGTRALVVDGEATVMGEAQGPPAGVGPGSANRAAEAVGHVVRTALGRGGAPAPARRLCAALAGAGRQPLRRELEEALLAGGLAREVRVVSDLEAGYFDAFGDGPGLLLAAGTGSVAWARDGQGRTARAGGWGPRVGDEGSGYSLGTAAVRAVLRAHDGRGAATALTPAVLEATGLEDPEELVDWAAGASRAELAALAPLVMRGAEDGDPVAGALAADAVRELEAHLDALLRTLEGREAGEAPASRWTVALAGGLLRPGAWLRDRVEAAVRERGARVATGEVYPARGAARLALRDPGE